MVHHFISHYYIQNVAQEIRENGGILKSSLAWLKLALQTMAGVLSSFFDVSFYAFNHNYSFFNLLFPE
jgi:hypothetical protein